MSRLHFQSQLTLPSQSDFAVTDSDGTTWGLPPLATNRYAHHVDTIPLSEIRGDSDIPKPSSDFPEGGRQGWLTVAGASACLFSSFGWINCVGVFQDQYQFNQLKDYSASDISWISSLQVFFLVFGGLLVGKMLDDYGPGLPLALGTFLHVFGLMLTSVADNYVSIMLCQGVLSPIGASMVFYPAFNCASTWFLKKRGAALGLIAMGSSIGGVIFPIMLINLIPKIGFGWSVRSCAFLILGLLIFANLTVRSRFSPNKKPFVAKAFLLPLAERPFALLTAAIFFFYWGMFIPITFIVVEAKAQGMPNHLADYLVPILNGASIIGRTVPNALADKVGHFNMMISMATLTTVLILGVWLPTSGSAASIVFAALFGISSGAGIGLTPVLCAHISPVDQINIRSGTAFSISAFAALTGSPIGGQIIAQSHGSFDNVKVFAGVACGIGTVLYIAARFAQGGLRAKKL
ncbi:major facilitator superfamily domain-containing protein [Hypoxylon sp. NC1633]|nr:major facilitator superfamily domain-containing protein [Hypoxylon sp. NC1633]